MTCLIASFTAPPLPNASFRHLFRAVQLRTNSLCWNPMEAFNFTCVCCPCTEETLIYVGLDRRTNLSLPPLTHPSGVLLLLTGVRPSVMEESWVMGSKNKERDRETILDILPSLAPLLPALALPASSLLLCLAPPRRSLSSAPPFPRPTRTPTYTRLTCDAWTLPARCTAIT